jgi:predicted kinase
LECIVLIGLPGSGKTTFYTTRFAGTHAHVSRDLRLSSAGTQPEQVRRHLAAGRSVVVDNTHLTAKDRVAIIAMARASGARVIGFFFDDSTRACVARNEQREGRAKVPKVAIFAGAKRLERPQLAEGFDELYVVHSRRDNEFDVTSEHAR